MVHEKIFARLKEEFGEGNVEYKKDMDAFYVSNGANSEKEHVAASFSPFMYKNSVEEYVPIKDDPAHEIVLEFIQHAKEQFELGSPLPFMTEDEIEQYCKNYKLPDRLKDKYGPKVD